jgi:hypothetical protein
MQILGALDPTQGLSHYGTWLLRNSWNQVTGHEAFTGVGMSGMQTGARTGVYYRTPGVTPPRRQSSPFTGYGGAHEGPAETLSGEAAGEEPWFTGEEGGHGAGGKKGPGGLSGMLEHFLGGGGGGAEEAAGAAAVLGL